MADTQNSQPQIIAEPTKTFFVDMLTRDIPLEQAVLDLVDNSVDGAKALKSDGALPFDGRVVRISFNKDEFRIFDNCGGFDTKTAMEYAFRFGRPPGTRSTPHSIGQFGVGMKRALFKFGDTFSVRSATKSDCWAVRVHVPTWEGEAGWFFPMTDFVADENLSKENPGTEIVVTDLRLPVGLRFNTKVFETAILTLIKSKHRQFIAGGLSISVNGNHVDATSLRFLVSEDAKFRPGTDEWTVSDEGKAPVDVRIVVGIGPSSPREAGWYVVCNGRVILEGDRRRETGWGLVEDQTNSVVMPSFHNQFARFRGVVSFDSDDSARVPWNTTKTDVDQDNPVWRATFTRMMEMMRPVISFLNDLDNDIDEHTKDHSPLHDYISKTTPVAPETLPAKATFAAPARGTLPRKGPKTIKIQYSKPVDQVEFLMEELSVGSAKAVGERTFELTYEQMGGE